MESEYVRFARTRGLGTRAILRQHGLRNLIMPALTLQFASIAEIFGGSVLVEQVFSYPGLGQAAVLSLIHIFQSGRELGRFRTERAELLRARSRSGCRSERQEMADSR